LLLCSRHRPCQGNPRTATPPHIYRRGEVILGGVPLTSARPCTAEPRPPARRASPWPGPKRRRQAPVHAALVITFTAVEGSVTAPNRTSSAVPR
jgi:hypothetical protein